MKLFNYIFIVYFLIGAIIALVGVCLGYFHQLLTFAICSGFSALLFGDLKKQSL